MVRIAIVQIQVFSWTNEAECDCAKKKLLSFSNREMQSKIGIFCEQKKLPIWPKSFNSII